MNDSFELREEDGIFEILYNAPSGTTYIHAATETECRERALTILGDFAGGRRKLRRREWERVWEQRV